MLTSAQEYLDMEIVTVDQNRNYLGSSSDLVVGQPGPSSGQELVPRPAYEIAVAETPEKKTLRRQVSDLVKALHHKEYMVHQKVHEVKVDAGTKVRALLKDQQDNFKRVATEFEEYFRDVCAKEVAEARADIHGQATAAINDRERRIADEHNRLNQIKDDLVKAHSAVDTEKEQKAHLVAEAENAIQRQRAEIITQAEQSMQEQSKIVSHRLSELQQEASAERTAREFERKVREQAQGDLQRVSARLMAEANVRDSALAEARQMKDEAESEKAEATLTRQKLQQALQEGRLIFVKSEKQEEQIAKLIEENKVANQTIVGLKADIASGASENFKQQVQQYSIHQDAVQALEARIEELEGMVKTVTFQNGTLRTKNQILEKELMAVKESSTMILETSKEQHRKDLDKFLRERRRATEHEDAAAAKILKLEEEIASLQEALTSDAQDAEARAELERFMKIHKARGDKAECFQIHTDDEDEGDDEILEGERPFEYDDDAYYGAGEDDEDA